MRIFTTTGFYGTGSSAITDLAKEYSHKIECKTDYEIRFLFDPDGISDLEYNLVENPNRHNSSHAIKRFYKQMKMLDHVGFINRYNKYFNGEFMPAVNRFLKDIVFLEYNAAWHYDVYEKGVTFYVISRLYAKINEVLHRTIRIPLDGRALIPKDEKAYLGVYDEKLFLQATRKLVTTLVGSINKENKECILLDQLVPPSNLRRYIRYFDNIRIIVVDRDPRDIYLLEKVIWRGTVVPSSDVKTFCEWYDWVRDIYYKDSKEENVINIQFEDMIFDYDRTVEKIEQHFSLSKQDHIEKRKFFKPEVSIKNTQLWKKYPEYQDDIAYIEKRLAKYCYTFPDNQGIQNRESYEIF